MSANNKVEWPRTKALYFIDLIKPYAILWDVKNKDYRYKIIRDKIYVELIKERGLDITSKDCVKNK
jgi:hypothetical protein